MNTAAQFLRWGVPGWLAILIFYTYSFVEAWAGNDLIGILTDGQQHFWSSFGLLSASLVGIPLGFIFYQIYFALFQSVTIPEYMDVRCFVSQKRLQSEAQKYGISIGNIFFEEPTTRQKNVALSPWYWLMKSIARSEKISKQWHHVQCLMRFKAVSDNTILPRWQTMSGLFHSLGAIEIAIIMSMAFYTILKILIYYNAMGFWLIFTSIALAVGLICLIGHIIKKHTARWSIVTKMHNDVAAEKMILVMFLGYSSCNLFYHIAYVAPVNEGKHSLLVFVVNTMITFFLLWVMRTNRKHLKSDMNTFLEYHVFNNQSTDSFDLIKKP